MTNSKMLLSACGLVVAMSSAAMAQTQLFSWSGRVDQEIQLTMSGRNVTVSQIGLREPGTGSSNVTASMPRENGQVTVTTGYGRGTVEVIQQPSAANGYTAIVRVRDPQPGQADYRVTAYWNGTAAGEVGPPYGRGRDRGNGRVGDIQRDDRMANRTVLHWSGEIDDNVLITLQPSGVTYRTLAGKQPGGIVSTFSGIPQNATQLRVNQTEGRGNVVVLRQPTAANNYSAVIRVTDPQRGSSHYTFDVTWR
jgi:hypothetical protein